MAIPLPNLDDRRWTDLVEQGRALVPLYAPEWTDHNASDPGITLMELLAWVAEMDVFQLNRVTDRGKRRLLSLLGLRSEPPRAATAVVVFSPKDPAGVVALPAWTEVSGTNAAGEAVSFRTAAALQLADTRLVALQRRDANGYRDFTPAWRRGESIAVLGDAPGPGTEFYLGLERPLPRAEWTSLYLALAGTRATASERARLAQADGSVPPHHDARVVWEYAVEQSGALVWRAFDTDDATRALTLSGAVRLRPGDDMTSTALGAVPAALHYVRCRITRGTLDAPPVLEHVGVNAVEAVQSVQVRRRLGEAAGVPDETLSLRSGAVVEGSLHVEGQEGAAVVAWARKDDLAASKRRDAHYLLDPTTGDVTFGDGEHGRVPPRGTVLYATAELTRAEDGNGVQPSVFVDGDGNGALGLDVPLLNDAIAVTALVTSHDGAAAETLSHAIGRAALLREAPLRAVTTSDFETLAKETPGTNVARVQAIANLYPGLDCVRASGVVTVVVLPASPGLRPQPSAGLLGAVAAYLEERRVIGTRALVIAPTYVEVAVRARVKAFAKVDKAALVARIARALDAFFHPLTGGPAASGWPLGRDVYRAEVLQVIDETEGVDHVLGLELLREACSPTCGNLCLARTALVAAGTHEIEVS